MLYFIQRLRDEAHRFVIGSHRKLRKKDIREAGLQEIPGIGPSRKRALLLHFGTLKEIERASIADLGKVPGSAPKAPAGSSSFSTPDPVKYGFALYLRHLPPSCAPSVDVTASPVLVRRMNIATTRNPSKSLSIPEYPDRGADCRDPSW